MYWRDSIEQSLCFFCVVLIFNITVQFYVKIRLVYHTFSCCCCITTWIIFHLTKKKKNHICIHKCNSFTFFQHFIFDYEIIKITKGFICHKTTKTKLKSSCALAPFIGAGQATLRRSENSQYNTCGTRNHLAGKLAHWQN